MQEKYITQSIIQQGVITIPVDNKEMLQEADAYNRRMSSNRARMIELQEIKKGYLLGSVVVGLGILVISNALSNRHPIYFIILGMAVVSLLVWGIMRNNLFLILHMITSVGMVFWNSGFVILLLLDIVLGTFYLWKDEPLRKELDYPNFNSIRIEIKHKHQQITGFK
ncbi:MAG: hypothetical protein IJ833_00190 [Lachnospiraceae bacterium]|nr:hypothetical protein [Lachnospiraceae bacterium]